MAYKYQTLFKELRSMAERMPERSQLPSVRNIMEVYGVSQATVDRAIDELRAHCIIDTVEGEGFFVKAKGSHCKLPEHLKICLAQNDYPSTLFAMIEDSFRRFFESAGHEFSVVRYPWAKGLSGMLKPGLMDAFFALPPMPELNEREIEFVKSLDIPAICLSADAARHGLDAIGTDFELGGMMAADHLIKLGHSKLAFLAGEPFNHDSKAMLAGFRRQALLSGLQAPELIDCRSKQGDLAMRLSYEGLSAALRQGSFQPSALFCPSDCCAIGAVRACHERGVAIPSQLSIVGFNGVPESEFSVPSISTLRHDLDGFCAAALEIVKARFDGAKEPSLKLLPPLLTPRESSGPAKR